MIIEANANSKVSIRGVTASDADHLFPLIHQSTITDSIVWDGPTNLAEYKLGFVEREAQHKARQIHFFTILADQTPIGTITIRTENEFRASIGLWVGQPYHGKGFGTEAVRLVTEYGFHELKLQRIEAEIFVGNMGSRKIFEKNGYTLEGTIRCAVKKRGVLLDEWIFRKVQST